VNPALTCRQPGVHLHEAQLGPFPGARFWVLVNAGGDLPVLSQDEPLMARLADLLERHGLVDVSIDQLVPFPAPDPTTRIDHPGAHP